MKEYKDMTDNEIREIINGLYKELDERKQSKKREWIEKFQSILNEYTEITGKDCFYYENDDCGMIDIAFPDLIEIFENELEV